MTYRALSEIGKPGIVTIPPPFQVFWITKGMADRLWYSRKKSTACCSSDQFTGLVVIPSLRYRNRRKKV
jgi:hypothetical protein